MVLKSGFFFPKRARCLGYGPRPATKKEKSNIFAVGGRFKQIMIIHLPLFFFLYSFEIEIYVVYMA